MTDRYEVGIICQHGEEATIYLNMDENDPLFEQAVSLVAAEQGLKFASIEYVEFIPEKDDG